MNKFFTKRNLKLASAVLAVMLVAVVLTGCATTNAPIDPSTANWWDKYIVLNMSKLLLWIAKLFGNNFGWAIIVFTILIRLLLLPLNILSTRNMKKTYEIQPQMDALKKKYSSKDTETQRTLQQETQKLYSEAGINPMAGCLPMLLQLPVMFALYQSIYRTPELRAGHFLWMQLGSPDPIYVMAILAGIFTFATSFVSMMSQPKSSQNTMTKVMTYVMPIMVTLPALNIASAITLYWVVSNLFQLVQTFVLQNPFKYRREQAEKEEAAREKQRAVKRAIKRAKRK